MCTFSPFFCSRQKSHTIWCNYITPMGTLLRTSLASKDRHNPPKQQWQVIRLGNKNLPQYGTHCCCRDGAGPWLENGLFLLQTLLQLLNGQCHKIQHELLPSSQLSVLICKLLLHCSAQTWNSGEIAQLHSAPSYPHLHQSCWLTIPWQWPPSILPLQKHSNATGDALGTMVIPEGCHSSAYLGSPLHLYSQGPGGKVRALGTLPWCNWFLSA